GDDDGRPALEGFLGLGHNIAVGREDVLDERVVLTEELAALVVVLDGKACALNAVVGENGIDEREGRRLVIGLAEIVDGDVGGRRGGGRGLGVFARSMGYRRNERQGCEGPNWRTLNLQRVHLSKVDATNHPSSGGHSRLLRA